MQAVVFCKYDMFIQDYIASASSTTMPIVTALLLGLMTIISPCPFCSNIAAIGYIGKDVDNKHKVILNGLMYILGKVVAYTVLCLVFIFGAQIDGIQHFFETYGEPLLGPFMIVCGLFILIGGHHEGHHHHDEGHPHGLSSRFTRFTGKKRNIPDWLWSFVLGIVFSMAFCPYSGVLFFGMLVPLTMAQPIAWSWTMPVVFGLGTGIPVIIVAWLLSYSIASIGKINHNIQHFEVWFRRICALLFIGIGIYMCISIFGMHHHHYTDPLAYLYGVPF